MRSFNYAYLAEKVIDNEVLDLLISIHEYKAKQEFYIKKNPDILNGYAEIAKLQNGISADRCYNNQPISVKSVFEWSQGLVHIAPYPSVETFWKYQNNFCYERNQFVLTKDFVFEAAKELQCWSWMERSKVYRNNDKPSEYKGIKGEKWNYKSIEIEIKPLPSKFIEKTVDNMIESFNEAIEAGTNPLILMPIFIADFLSIQPFSLKNEMLVYIIMLRTLINKGYEAVNYISLIRFIEENRYDYLEALDKSRWLWNEGRNDYSAFVKCFLSIVKKMYKQFDEQIIPLYTENLKKSDIINNAIRTYGTVFTKSEINILFPEVSGSTIEKNLSKLYEEGIINKIGDGRTAAYVPESSGEEILDYYYIKHY